VNLIFVLGMHRSGTSAMTRVLALAGACLPETLLGAGHGNPTGHWESEAVVNLNDEMLRTLGRSWSSPVALPDDWLARLEAERFLERATETLQRELPAGEIGVLKDPRLCRLLPIWIKAAQRADMKPHALMMLRSPFESTASLEARDGAQPARTMLLTLWHLLEMERHSRGLPRATVSYDGLLADWRQTLTTIKDGLDLPLETNGAAGVEAIDAFLDRSLQHHAIATPTREDALCEMQHKIFMHLLTGCDAAKDRLFLDEQFVRLRDADAIMAPILTAWEAELRDKMAIDDSLQQTKAQIEALEGRISEQTVDRDLVKAALTQLSQAIGIATVQGAASDRLMVIEAQLVQARAMISDRDAEIASLSQRQRDADALLAQALAERDEQVTLAQSLATQLTDAQHRLNDAFQDIAVRDEQISTLAGIEQTCTTLQHSLTEQEAQLVEKNEALQAVSEQLTTLQDEHVLAQQALAQTRGTLEETETRNEQLQSDLQQATARAGSTDIQCSRLAVERDEGRAHIRLLTARSAQVQRQMLAAHLSHFAVNGTALDDLFDDEAYRRTYPDVDIALRDGSMRSSLTHWLMHGRAEGRQDSFVEVTDSMIEALSERAKARRPKRKWLANLA